LKRGERNRKKFHEHKLPEKEIGRKPKEKRKT